MSITRRSFLASGTLGAGAFAATIAAGQETPNIAGFEKTETKIDASKTWQPISDRKIRMGLVGYGVCQFAAQFGFQTHPNVELIAVSDLIPERCAELARVTKCMKTYPSLEEMVKDDTIEAIFVATDAPSHGKHCMEVLKHGKHVAVAVPAVFGVLEEAEKLYELVKTSGLKYMMLETSAYHDQLYAMREIYKAGGFGKMVYSEGEYFHYFPTPLDAYKKWRTGLPPQWYPTHSNAYYIAVTDHSFTEVSCMGKPSHIEHLQAKHNRYANPFGSEVALFRTSEGGMARMTVAWDIPGYGAETGRVGGELGSFWQGRFVPGSEEVKSLVAGLNLKKPPLPPTVSAGGHGGSHGYLGHEFVTAILEDRQPLVDISMALNMTVPGIVAHQSALKNGELMKIKQYKRL